MKAVKIIQNTNLIEGEEDLERAWATQPHPKEESPVISLANAELCSTATMHNDHGALAIVAILTTTSAAVTFRLPPVP